ncbi:hypothetical protein [Sediminitomix flava]|uniref:Uncharacterized protein n=1 Tax=Sediminitomix flava TaxID=379075 RepID=A0A315Z8W0_SEDFL|nr:hypothetical protein [Sediminitomix flava]PWJ40130.1 hypothetical protein BC781_105194 [Sediminitomix flava]
MQNLYLHIVLAAEDGTSIVLKNKEQLIHFTKISEGNKTENVISPLAEEWEFFFRYLTGLKWDKQYVNVEGEGAYWSVSAKIHDFKFQSEGTDDYPENFEQFLETLLAFLGLNEF